MSKGKPGDVIVKEGKHIWAFWCPGCACAHGIDDTIWEFDGNTKRPTIGGSILVKKSTGVKQCHSFVKDGMIQFLDDTEGMMAGTTMELPEWPYLERKDF